MLRCSRSRLVFAAMILASGTLFQTSCSTLATEATSGLASSIANQFIRNFIYDVLGASSGIGSLST